MIVLGIESTCDETAASLVEDGRRLLSNVISTSVKEQALYGGVVPEIASRRHCEFISATVKKALLDAGKTMDDVDAVAVTYGPGLVGALLQVYPNTTFTEMFCPDWEQDVILLSHMGESNPKLAQWKPLISDCPFNYNSCGDTTAMYNCLRKGKAVYVNLAPMQDHFTLIVSDVEMLDEGLERGAYRHSTQGWMKPCKPLPQFLKEFSLAGGTHHSALVYDANIEEIKAFGTMMGFEVIEIK